jgi:SAM-dependent methyltransferase
MFDEQSEPAEYKSFVGPAAQYDLIGAAQFALLYALGLRAHQRLLDIGCGSLRAGRMLIAYLDPDRYVGVEPNRWLIDEAVKNQLGETMLTIKKPTFDANAGFALAHLGHFDFVLVQGVATNTGPSLLPALLASIKQTLAPGGIAAATFIHPDSGDHDAVEVDLGDVHAPAWRYPGCYCYPRAAITDAVATADLAGEPVGWYHPRHTWWLLAHQAELLPPTSFLAMLNGATLASGLEESSQRNDL